MNLVHSVEDELELGLVIEISIKSVVQELTISM